MRQIEAALEKCDLFIAIGTSGTVYPAAGFVEIAKSYGAQTLRFDIALPLDGHQFDQCFHAEASKMIPKWVGGLIGDKPAFSIVSC
jgi:NAD-dependent deacetylase